MQQKAEANKVLRIPLAECSPSNNNPYSLFNSPTLFKREQVQSATYPKSKFNFERSFDGNDYLQKENSMTPRLQNVQEKGFGMNPPQFMKSNSTQFLPQGLQPQKKTSLYQKLQNGKLNKENKISESLAMEMDRENFQSMKNIQNKGNSYQNSRPQKLRVMNTNILNCQIESIKGTWNPSVDSNPASAKSFFFQS
jgi:hypothetical protein